MSDTITKTVRVPKIDREHLSPECIRNLIMLYQNTLHQIENHEEVVFDFTECPFIANHACVFLGGLDQFIRRRFAISAVSYGSFVSPKVEEYLQKIGFFNRDARRSHLPYADFSMTDIAGKRPYKDIKILLDQPEFPFRSKEDRQIIRENIGELFLNVYQHSQSPSGCSSSAQYYPGEDIFRYALVDFGIGISAKIQQYFADKFNRNISEAEALLQALQERFTTKEGSHGLGLKNLKEFVLRNRSKMSIFCNRVYYHYDGSTNQESGFSIRTNAGFNGTMVVIDFNVANIC